MAVAVASRVSLGFLMLALSAPAQVMALPRQPIPPAVKEYLESFDSR